MMHEVKPSLKRILKKIRKKDRALYERVLKKIQEIITSSVEEIEHYKNLRYDMKDSKRVHVGSFVLVFRFDKRRNFISFEDFQHHDFIYVGE
ncbi:MAG: type II toxin-antitoxin system RelE/ParE family toxin [Nanoarchaeota archaeon]|nr:type II toxin-antitoxin system RelE/ParE family toxin [Nanoarchaeota archaeon]